MLRERVPSAIVMIALVVLVIWLGGTATAIGLCLLSLEAFRELLKACRQKGHEDKPFAVIGYILCVSYYAVIYLTGSTELGFAVVTVAFLCMLGVYVFQFPKYPIALVMRAFFCYIYAVPLFCYGYQIRCLPNGIGLILLVAVCSAVCDTFAYFFGRMLGKHKLAPVLSPKKSIEGAVGGCIASTICGVLLGQFYFQPLMPGQHMAIRIGLICAVGSIISMIGDLAASGLKREHGVKDYAKLIPGHGGIMDRFDSVVFTMPIIYYLAIILIQFE